MRYNTVKKSQFVKLPKLAFYKFRLLGSDLKTTVWVCSQNLMNSEISLSKSTFGKKKKKNNHKIYVQKEERSKVKMKSVLSLRTSKR